MEPTVIFIVHDNENGVRFSPVDAVSEEAMSIDWDEEILSELEAIPGHKSVSINDRGELPLGYIDDAETSSQGLDIEEEFSLGNQLVAKAAGKELADVEFTPCPCLVFGMLESMSPLVIGVGLMDFQQFEPSRN